MDSDRPGLRRALTFAVIAAAVEVALRTLVWRAPVFATLVGPLYWIVAGGMVVAVWHAARRRSGHDRRHGDRRHRDGAP